MLLLIYWRGTKVNYQIFYEVLLNLREQFYKHGRFDDSNAKLDEIIKLLVLSFYEAKKESKRFNIQEIEKISLEKFNDNSKIALTIKELFEEAINDSMFTSGNERIFQEGETLHIKDDEDLFATRLVLELSKIDFKTVIDSNNFEGFDIINECFGHFVRDNFRQNKEDAQYMTPKEIVDPLIEIIIADLKQDKNFLKELTSNEKNFILMDPTCGVGTLMIETLRGLINFVSNSSEFEDKEMIINKLKQTALVGQDKVDRMVKFTKINAMMMGCDFSNIHVGNSITGLSFINKYANSVDLIIANPPFGANFSIKEIQGESFYPFLKEKRINTIPSELLILEKSMHLLKDNGRLAIILPDSVVSSKGLQAEFRTFIMENFTVEAVIELPATAFAQAGTRTKTIILYLKKIKNPYFKTFMGICNDLGYIVKERKGVPVKFYEGKNEMKEIAEAYKNYKINNQFSSQILSISPSCTIVETNDLLGNFLTPNFYDAKRLQIFDILKNINKDEFEIVKLSDIASLDSKSKLRKKQFTNENIKHISLLHINKDHTIDFQEVENFDPISKGIDCNEGDILFAKLNPRIPRMTVVPNFSKKLVCSNEFEILLPKNNINPYLILLIMSSNFVNTQIQALTAGTSSSHNRIKSEQLGEIIIPFPKTHSKTHKIYNEIAQNIELAINQKYVSQGTLTDQKLIYENLFK